MNCCTVWPRYFIVILCKILTSFLFASALGKSNNDQLPSTLRKDPKSLTLASTDYGNIVKEYPLAVLQPSSPVDILNLVKFAYQNHSSPSFPFTIAARGRSHSVHGQALARGGVVVEMSSLSKNGVRVSRDDSSGYYYADVGSQMLWIDVLNTTLKYGLAPVTWTDYLYLTVGGTLSNAGIGGQTFRFGPQISNVYEMDVITGTGEFVTCSPKKDSNLFYAVLGGLGQFGIITRARIALNQAPKRVKWVRLLYSNFSTFTEDQEHLISINGSEKNALDYLEGMLLLNVLGESDDWRSLFPPATHSNISSFIAEHGIIYSIELAKFYNERTQDIVEEELQSLFKLLRFVPGYKHMKDVSYVDFLNRVRVTELELRSQGLWEVQHPWLNLFIPKSGIIDFNEGALRSIMLTRNITAGTVLIYPVNRNKWDNRTSAVIPEEDIFYIVSFLHASGFGNWQVYVDQNQEMLRYCGNVGIKFKRYLGHHNTQGEWISHFGPKWSTFAERKHEFDPMMILSPGQKIFNK